MSVAVISPEFLLTSLVVVVAPGTGVLYTLAAALARGRRASVAAAIGCTLGIVPHMVAAVLGLAALLHASAVLFQTVKLAGVAYLLVMAWQALKAGGALQIDREAGSSGRSFGTVVLVGILANILNPKLSLFFLAFLPQFVAADAKHPLGEMLALSAVFMAMTFAVFLLYGLAAAAFRTHVVSRPAVVAWMRRAFAAAFVALGVKLALAER
ncbi:LysE family translocator [Rhodovulum sp. PH10]|uniref:LysE family translocator n=1 Tax=Rhodovulum sp. PH10 TaxID=1187851 RepID=UPI001ED94BE4|nr:LysE family translocator [Rhodovulum sp. PH10]